MEFFHPYSSSWLGKGGVPALGERRLTKKVSVFFPQIVHPFQIEHRIPDVLGNKKPDFDGKVTMVVGSGASAATVLQSLKALGTSKVPST